MKSISRACLRVLLMALWLTACGDDEQLPHSFDTGQISADMGMADRGVDQLSADLQPPMQPHQLEVEALAKPIMDGQWTVGMVVGLLSPQGAEYYTFGSVEQGGSPPDERTLFEIGSISKTFTGLALARMIEAGDVTLEQPVQELLPGAEVQVPQRSGKHITLRHLSTHTSGLPRMPDNVDPTDTSSNPFREYTRTQLYEFLSGHTLARDPGAGWEYSNLAVGLLGHALSLKAGIPFEQLIAEQITTPLGLRDTVLQASGDQEARVARGYDHNLEVTPAFHFGVLAPAGALRSTATDMLTYLGAQLGDIETALDSAITLTHELHYDGDNKMGLGWILQDSHFIWHNGGTIGFESFAGIDTQAKTAVVVLSNTYSGYAPQTRLGLALVKMMAGDPYDPVELPPTVEVPAETLARYVGTYRLGAAGFEASVTLDGDHLFATWEDQPRYRLFARSEYQFYLRIDQIGFNFLTDSTGQYNTLVFTTTGSKLTLTRVP